MLFNPNRGAAQRQAKAVFGVIAAVYVGLLCAVAYAILHFMMKYW